MPSPNLHLTFRDGGTGDAGDPYTGLDRFGRLVETLWKQGGNDRVRSKYGRNQVGGVVWRRDEAAHAQGKKTQDNYYGYDGLQQVKQRQRGDLTGTAPDYTGVTNLQQKEDWTHDATGNWAAYSNTSPTNGQTRTHNTANEITEISSAPGEVTPACDPVGNMLTLPKEPGTSTDEYALTWDAWNRLVAVKDGSTVVASYTYDGLTRRLTKTNGTEVRHYYYNNQWRALEERVDVASGPVDRQYTWGLRDRWDLLRRKRSVSGSLDETLFLLRDYLDPVAIVDETGAVVERYAYDAFGNARFLAPDYSIRIGSDFDWDFLFHAEFRDADTNLYNYGFRYYDAKLGKWLSRDPLGEAGGTNLYDFAGNAPVLNFDVLGSHIEQADPHENPTTAPLTPSGPNSDRWALTKNVYKGSNATAGGMGVDWYSHHSISKVTDCCFKLFLQLKLTFSTIYAPGKSSATPLPERSGTVGAHEQRHRWIDIVLWNQFADEANRYLGTYCATNSGKAYDCADAALTIIRKRFDVFRSEAALRHAKFHSSEIIPGTPNADLETIFTKSDINVRNQILNDDLQSLEQAECEFEGLGCTMP